MWFVSLTMRPFFQVSNLANNISGQIHLYDITSQSIKILNSPIVWIQWCGWDTMLEMLHQQ